MSPPCKKLAVVGGDGIFSKLPVDVIHKIFECLPLREAAKMGVLSRSWRHLWSGSPRLVFDRQLFWYFAGNEIGSANKYVNVINKVLFQHHGSLSDFSLYIPNGSFSWHEHIDNWLSFLSRNGIKQLCLSLPPLIRYKLHSCIFSCLTLTHLKLGNIIFKPPVDFSGFKELVQLEFDGIDFAACNDIENFKISAPKLRDLKFVRCNGIEKFKISASCLLSVEVLCCTEVPPIIFDIETLTSVFIVIGQSQRFAYQERKSSVITLVELHQKLPKVELLRFDDTYLELAAAATVDRSLSFAFHNLTRISLVSLTFHDFDKFETVLHLLSTSPSLVKFEVEDSLTNEFADERLILDLLKPPGCIAEMLSLKYVVFKSIKGSKAELTFIKRILARSPNLESMCFNYRDVEYWRQPRIKTKLEGFHRSSMKAVVIQCKHLRISGD